MKTEVRKQVVDLDQLTDIASKIVVRRCIGICFMVWSVQTPLVVYGVVHPWIGLSVGLSASGFVYWGYGDLVNEKVNQWVQSMLVVMTTNEDESKSESGPHPIKETSDLIIETNEDGEAQPEKVRITNQQLNDVIRVMFYDTYLTRSALDPELWPSLTEEWRKRTIQTKLRKLGIISHNNIFLCDEAGLVGRLEVESALSDSQNDGVGGSE